MSYKNCLWGKQEETGIDSTALCYGPSAIDVKAPCLRAESPDAKEILLKTIVCVCVCSSLRTMLLNLVPIRTQSISCYPYPYAKNHFNHVRLPRIVCVCVCPSSAPICMNPSVSSRMPKIRPYNATQTEKRKKKTKK